MRNNMNFIHDATNSIVVEQKHLTQTPLETMSEVTSDRIP
jgi:hypothetical protein